MRRGEVIGLSVKIARSRHLGTRAARKRNSQLESATNWLEYALNHLARSTNVTNSILLLAIVAMPIDRAYYALCMCFLLICITSLVGVGKGCRYHIPNCMLMQLMHARRTRDMCS